MKKWSEIKQATLDKLSMSEEEARDQNYLEKFARLANEAINIISNSVKPKIAAYRFTTKKPFEVVKFPEDYISYANIVNYLNGKPQPDVVFVNWNEISLPKVGDYVIFYNAIWREISDSDVKNDVELDIDPSVLNCIPTYLASQVLAQDDIQRSAILNNEFEMMLSRLDDTVMYQSESYKSIGGWY